MNGGVKASLLVSCLAFAGCTTTTREVKVRAIPDPSAVFSQGGDEIAVARGQMLLGNVGLALEGFRKAQRANPSDPAALAGIGDCYAVMGRFDLAQTSYESALALAPHNRKLLLGLADIFEREGKPALAMAARAEANIVSQVAPATSAAQIAPRPAPASVQQTVERPRPAIGSITVELPPARPVAAQLPRAEAAAFVTTVPIAQSKPAMPAPAKQVEIPQPSLGSATINLQPAHLVAHVQAQAAELPRAEILTSASVSTGLPAQSKPGIPARVERTVEVPRPSLGTVTVELPPTRPAEHVEAQVAELPTADIQADVAPKSVSLGLAAEVPAPALPAPVEQIAVIPRPSLASVAVDLTSPRPVEHVEAEVATMPRADIEADIPAAAAVAAPTPPARPSLPRKPLPTEDEAVAVALAPAPRLERLSAGEVALVTTGKALWSAPNQAPNRVRLASTNSVRWVALGGTRPNVQVLNAARSQGIAASARTVLSDRGWRRIAIGDAPAVLHKSEVLYPRSHAALGRRLAAQFGVAAHMAERDNVVLILGRDAVGRITGQRGS